MECELKSSNMNKSFPLELAVLFITATETLTRAEGIRTAPQNCEL